jgi:hypothetical protein
MPALADYSAGVSSIVTEASITCPECGSVERESMPTNACVFFCTLVWHVLCKIHEKRELSATLCLLATNCISLRSARTARYG